MLIREDLHTAFDRREFVFVPKAAANEAPVFVTHLLTDSPELGLLYHNTKLHPIDRVAPEFLFARFAWSIFPGIEGFLLAGVSRDLLSSTGQRWTASPDECQSYLKQPGKWLHSETFSKESWSETKSETESGEGDWGADVGPRKRRRRKPSPLSPSSFSNVSYFKNARIGSMDI